MSFRSSPLPLLHRAVLRAAQHIVPLAERDDFLRSWHAELWHVHHCVPRRRLSNVRLHIDLPLGVASDALWLRTHSLRRSLAGTPALCIASLLSLSLFSLAFAVLSYGGWRSLAIHLRSQAEHCLVAVPIILFVSSAIASFSRVELNSIPHTLRWINHLLFATLKISLAFLLTFLLSVCLSRPLYIPLPHAADLLQILFFVLFALLAVRWCFHDQEQRCNIASARSPPQRASAALRITCLSGPGPSRPVSRDTAASAFPRSRPAGTSTAAGLTRPPASTASPAPSGHAQRGPIFIGLASARGTSTIRPAPQRAADRAVALRSIHGELAGSLAPFRHIHQTAPSPYHRYSSVQ